MVIRKLATWLGISRRRRSPVADLVARDALRFLFQLGPEAFYLCDLKGTFIDGNEAAERLCGFEREELIGKSFLQLDLLSKDQIPKAAACLARCALGYAVGPDEYVLKRKDGEKIAIEITTIPVQIGGSTYVLGLSRDIAAQKRMAEELKEQEARYARAVSSGRVGVWDWDVQTGELYIDPILKELVGYKDDEIQNTMEDWQRFVHPEDIEGITKSVRETLRGDTRALNIEYRMACRDGSELWFLGRGEIFRDEAGQAVRLTGTNTDITQIKVMERRLRESHDELESLVRRRTSELRETNELLRNEVQERDALESELIRIQRLSALGQLSAGVSHNLNNILTGILGPALLLKSKISNPELLEHLDIVIRAGKRATDLVRRLHHAVAADPDHTSPIDLNAIVLEAVEGTRPRWRDETEGRGVEVTLTTDLDDVPAVEATQGGLYDACVNLILNAVDALPEGGHIEVRTRAVGNTVRMVFSDNGIGMDDETRQRVFEPFFTTKSEVGTGLGLSTVYGAVTRWGGSIEVESSPGEGTTFTLELPVSESPAEGGTVDQHVFSQASGARILVIEDEPFVADLLRGILDSANTVSVYDRGDQAIAAFAPGAFDIALIDLGLPGTPGDAVARTLTRRDPDLVCVLVTGWFLEPDDRRLEPFDLRLQKPISGAAEVRNIVAEAISLRESRSPRDVPATPADD